MCVSERHCRPTKRLCSCLLIMISPLPLWFGRLRHLLAILLCISLWLFILSVSLCRSLSLYPHRFDNKNNGQLGKMLPPQALQQMGGAGALQGLLKAFEGATGMGGGGGKGGGGPFG